MSRIWALIAFAAFSTFTIGQVDAVNLCDCDQFVRCLDREKTSFFNGYRLCLAIYKPSLPPQVTSCFDTHAAELEVVATNIEHCVFNPNANNGICNKRTKRSNNFLKILEAKKLPNVKPEVLPQVVYQV